MNEPERLSLYYQVAGYAEAIKGLVREYRTSPRVGAALLYAFEQLNVAMENLEAEQEQ